MLPPSWYQAVEITIGGDINIVKIGCVVSNSDVGIPTTKKSVFYGIHLKTVVKKSSSFGY